MKRFLFSIFLLFGFFAFSQTELVFVYFKDKPNASTFLANPLTELTQKSIDRRTNLNLPLNVTDAPIEPTYLQNLQNLGFSVVDKSKWLNGVALQATASQITTLQGLSYVKSVETFVRNPGGKMKKVEKFKTEDSSDLSKTNFNYGNSASQIDQVNLRQLHVAGYTGTGVTIAVIDTGFPYVNTGSAFSRMRTNNHIKGGYNFVNKSTDIYNTSLNTHGANCLGIIGGYINNTFVGSAPDADFYLYASENANVEIPEEQIYWIEAAEEADRKGVDVISTSLGYTTFDDGRYDYNYADMNGETTFISRGAQLAAEKGIFVLIANGNEATSAWYYLSAPADNAKVFSIGGVTSTGSPSSFSSFGPNAAGVVKPDAAARGTGTYYAYNNSSYSGSGTSYATPLAAGGVACLLQAMPVTKNRDEVKNKLRQTASLAPSYTDQMGYGILNFGNALSSLTLSTNENTKANFKIYPIPAKSEVNISTTEKIKNVEVYNSLGQFLFNSNATKINVEKLVKGTYFLKIKTDKGTNIEKFIKE